jgi:hypothetical protein
VAVCISLARGIAPPDQGDDNKLQMHRRSSPVLLALVLLAIASALAGTAIGIAAAAGPPKLVAADPHGLVPPRGAKPSPSGGGDLVWHNGPIMTSAAVTAIYWGPSWGYAAFVVDKIGGLDDFYSGVGNSTYLGTNTEYFDSGGHVGTSVSYSGHLLDTSAAPRHAPRTSTVLAEVAKMITNPVPNGYYPVYVDTKRGHTGYCAWHSNGTINGVPVQFAFFFNLDGDLACDPQDTYTGHSQGLAALANLSGHELSEAFTDPQHSGWYDKSGDENADKCAWTFNQPVILLNNTTWKLQGNWSNAAYDGGQTGYAAGGCIDGN